MNHQELTRTFKSLDSAPRHPMDDVTQRRADARKAQILASTLPTSTLSPITRSRCRLWALPVAGLAAATVAGMVLIGTLTPTPAYASWSPTPTPLTAGERAIAGTACVDSVDQTGAKVVLAERRGDWIGVAAITPYPGVVTCLVYLPVGANRADHVTSGYSGGQGAIPTKGEFTDGAISEFFQRGIFGIGTSPAVAFNVGNVGPDVAAVDITTADGELVHATVDHGRFIAWWPGHAFGNKTEGNGGPAPELRYRITLTDGTVTDNAQFILPK